MISDNWSRENIAWLSGLIEGEGNFSKLTNCRAFNIRVVMTDEDVVRKAYAIAGCGNVRGPIFPRQKTKSGGDRKPVWEWCLSRSKFVLALAYAIYPFMGSRRQARIELLVSEILKMRNIHGRRHGTTSMYNMPCRCHPCVMANREYHRKNREYHRSRLV